MLSYLERGPSPFHFNQSLNFICGKQYLVLNVTRAYFSLSFFMGDPTKEAGEPQV